MVSTGALVVLIVIWGVFLGIIIALILRYFSKRKMMKRYYTQLSAGDGLPKRRGVQVGNPPSGELHAIGGVGQSADRPPSPPNYYHEKQEI